MNVLAPFLIGILFAAGVYNLLRRSLTKILIGFGLLGHAANLLVFASGGLDAAAPPVIPAGSGSLAERFADPLPQALVLTAIVIGFGITGFFTALVFHADRTLDTDDPDALGGEAG